MAGSRLSTRSMLNVVMVACVIQACYLLLLCGSASAAAVLCAAEQYCTAC